MQIFNLTLLVFRHSFISFQDMTAFSPPADSWLIRNSNQKKESSKKEEVNKNKFFVPEANQLEDPCKKYLESSEIPVKSNKSLGTDDHFKSAVCSKNLLKVCEKLMTQPPSNKEFVSTSVEQFDIDDDFDAELSLMNERSRMEYYRNKHGNRRNSQSLPASPKMDRKSQAPVSHNPYFTITKTSDSSKPESSISFLTSLFGITAAKPTEAQANLAQKYDADNAFASKKNDPSFSSGSENSKDQQSGNRMTPKPHHYREMNIFSPTSM